MRPRAAEPLCHARWHPASGGEDKRTADAVFVAAWANSPSDPYALETKLRSLSGTLSILRRSIPLEDLILPAEIICTRATPSTSEPRSASQYSPHLGTEPATASSSPLRRSAGGFDPSYSRWVHPKYPFFLPVRSSAASFAARFSISFNRRPVSIDRSCPQPSCTRCYIRFGWTPALLPGRRWIRCREAELPTTRVELHGGACRHAADSTGHRSPRVKTPYARVLLVTARSGRSRSVTQCVGKESS